jgi:hypothetical protein
MALCISALSCCFSPWAGLASYRLEDSIWWRT